MGSKQIVKQKMKGLLAERLIALRKANNMTATQCAAELEISIAAWSQWEKAKRDPSLSDLPKICWMFGVSMDDLFQLDRKKSPAGDFLSVKASSGGIAIGGVGNRVSGTIVAQGDVGHASMCRSCPYRKWGEKLRKQGLVIPGVDSK